MANIASHQRVNDILLGPLERPALRWLAAHLPARVMPDHLTAVGILGSLISFTGYALTGGDAGYLWLASCGLVVNWFGDSLDGTLARYRKIERPRYGFFVDHTVDAVSQVLFFIGLGISPYLRIDVALFVLVAYLLMTVLVYVRTCVDGVFQLSYSRIGPTELRVLAIAFNACMYFVGIPTIDLQAGSWSLWDGIGALVAGALATNFIAHAASHASTLARADE